MTYKFPAIRNDFILALLVAAVMIVAALILGASNNQVVPLQHKWSGYHYTAEPHNPLTFLSNWDGPDYLYIAKHGYTEVFWAGFFPLYPLTINVLNHAIPSRLDSALLITWLSFVGAIYFYLKIIKRLFKVHDPTESLKSVSFFVLFPTAVFFIASYTESLYAMLALGAIYFAMDKRWLASGLMAMVATATHITGPSLVLLLVLMLWEERVAVGKIVANGVIGCLGLIAYMAYLQVRFHDPFAFYNAQITYHEWNRHNYWTLLTTTNLFHLAFVVLTVLSGIYWWKRRRSFAIYSLIFLIIPLAGRQWGGFDRYALMIFPIQWMLYAYFRERQTLYPYMMALLGVTWAYILLEYAGGYIGS